MSKVYLMVTISRAGPSEQFAALNRTENLPVMMVALGKGTAGNEILDCLGLEGSEKIVLFSMVTGDVWKRVKRGMEHKLGIDVPGMGISFLVPVSSIGGKRRSSLCWQDRNLKKRRRHH